VRHFLESVVLEANSYIETKEEDNAERSEEIDGAKEKEAHEAPEDQEMTERLRSFAEADSGS
jgi:hypothetical protein